MRHVERLPLCILLLLSPSVLLKLVAGSVEQGVLQSLTSVWDGVLHSAAKEALKAIHKRPELEKSYLEAVPLDTLKVFIGRQHHLAVELGGTSYEVTLGAEADLAEETRPKADLGARGAAGNGVLSSGLVPHDHWHSREHRLTLPQLVLTGPLELVLNEPQTLSMFLPHAADVGIVRRVLLAEGATVKVSHMKSITLRRPVDLPRLPGQYLAEVYAHTKLGEPEQGFHYAPGMLFMSKHLRDAATNSSRKAQPLLSFNVEPVALGELSISAEGQHAEDVPPHLKIKKGADGTVEVSVRPGQVAQPNLNLHSLTHVWAWPLPQLDMSAWLPYESMLRGLLASHPFNIAEVVKHGVPLRLTKSSIRGISMMSFEMHVRSHLALPDGLNDGLWPKEETPLEIWDVVVQVHEVTSKSSAVSTPDKTRFRYQPMSVRRKAVFGNTLTVSEHALEELLMGNTTVPLGFESQDLGLARYA